MEPNGHDSGPLLSPLPYHTATVAGRAGGGTSSEVTSSCAYQYVVGGVRDSLSRTNCSHKKVPAESSAECQQTGMELSLERAVQ
jgi:hypothetical protein